MPLPSKVIVCKYKKRKWKNTIKIITHQIVDFKNTSVKYLNIRLNTFPARKVRHKFGKNCATDKCFGTNGKNCAIVA